MRKTITFAFAALAGISLAAQSQTSSSSNPSSGQPQHSVTVTGCLEAGPNNTFTLTAPASGSSSGATGTSGSTASTATGTTATTPAGSKVVKTITYALTTSGNADLKPHVGHKVQVTGTATAPESSATEVDRSVATEQAKSTSGKTPVVQTTEQAQIVTSHLAVNSVKPIADKCDILK